MFTSQSPSFISEPAFASPAGWTPRPTCEEIHRALRGFAARRGGLDAEEARWLRAALVEDLHLRLGYRSMNEYLRRALGYTRHSAADRLRVARALGELPGLTAALAAGQLPYTAVRELTRVVVAGTESLWLAAVWGRSLREIERLIVGRRRGDLPDTPARPDLRRRTIRFTVSAGTLDLLARARAAMVDATGEQLGQEAFLAQMCRVVLAQHGEDPNLSAEHPIAPIRCTTAAHDVQASIEPTEERLRTRNAAARSAPGSRRDDFEADRRARSAPVPLPVRVQGCDRDPGGIAIPGRWCSRDPGVALLDGRPPAGDPLPEELCHACPARIRKPSIAAPVSGGDVTPDDTGSPLRDPSPAGCDVEGSSTSPSDPRTVRRMDAAVQRPPPTIEPTRDRARGPRRSERPRHATPSEPADAARPIR